MMSDVVEKAVATTESKTLAEIELHNPDGKVPEQSLDGPSSNNNTQITENGSRVSDQSKQGGDGRGDDIDVGMTLAELSQGRAAKRSSLLQKVITRPESKEGFNSVRDQPLNGNVEQANDAIKSAGKHATPRKASRNRVVVADEKEVGKSESAAVEEVDKSGDGNQFSVGDFVWGKLRSRPWWPGRIFDPSDASDYALKYKHEGSLLVVYFGDDGSFGWSDPPQLKPFVENFVEMSRQSSSKGFLKAVEEAANEFGRLVKLEMTCSSSTAVAGEEDKQEAEVINAGIKKGVVVPKGKVGMCSVGKFEPREFLSDLRSLARCVSSADLLKIATLRSQVCAIYRSKNDFLLLELLGKQNAAEEEERFVGPVDDAVGGVVEELGGSEQPGTSEHRRSSMKRKSKSINLIMDKAASVIINEGSNDDDDNDDGKGKRTPQATASKSRKNKRRKVGDLCKENAKEVEKKELKDHDDKIFKYSRRNYPREASTATPTTSKTHRPKRLAELGDHVNVPKNRKSTARYTKKDKKGNRSIAVGNGLLSVEAGEVISSPRERKISKYLCPPYTNIAYSPRISTILKASILESTQTSNVGSPPPPAAESHDQTQQVRPPDEAISDENEANLTVPQTPKKDLSKENDHRVASPSNVLSQIRSAALTPMLPRDDEPMDSIKRFLSSYRSSKKYRNVPNDAAHEEDSPAGETSGQNFDKTIKESGGREAPDQDREEASLRSMKTMEMKAGKNNDKEPKSKQLIQKADKSGSSAALDLKFPPKFPLPSESDLNALFGKYGSLEESKTEVSPGSSCAKVVFLKSSDAEAAVCSCKESNPFGSSEVTYTIGSPRYLPAADMVNEDGTPKASSGSSMKIRSSKRKRSSSVSSDANEGVKSVKQKLQEVVKMVEKADGKVSVEMKLSLEKEITGLLEKVKALPASSSAS